MVGAWNADNKFGAAYVYERSGENWFPVTKLFASDRSNNSEENGQNFGYNLNINGDHAVIGAIYDSENGTQSGAAYIFSNAGGGWSESGKLLGTDSDHFGQTVSLDSLNVLVSGISPHTYIFSNFPSMLPSASLSLQSIAFDSTYVGSESDTTITIQNVGGANLIINDIQLAGGSSAFGSVDSDVTIAPNGSYALPIKFAPISYGPASDTLIVTHNGIEGKSRIVLSGYGAERPSVPPTYAGEFLVTTFAGTGDRRLWDDYRLEAEFNVPSGIDVDLDGKIYITDSNNHALRIIDTMGNVSSVKDVGVYPKGVAVLMVSTSPVII